MTLEEKVLNRVKKAMHTLEGIPYLVKEKDWEEVGYYLDEVGVQLSRAEDIVLDLGDQEDA